MRAPYATRTGVWLLLVGGVILRVLRVRIGVSRLFLRGVCRYRESDRENWWSVDRFFAL